MIPFTTNCTTCKAPLRVTSAAAIGQILACPKCNSMVCIELPAPEVPEVPSEPVRRSRLFRKSDSTTASKSPIEMDAASSSSGSISRSSQKAATGKNLGAFEELIELAATMLPGGAAPGSEAAASENPTAASADVKKSKLPVAKSLDKSDIKKAAAIAASAAVVATLSKETTASPAQTAAKVPPACTPGITSAVPHAGAASVTTHAPALAAKVTALPPPLPNTPLVASTASAETVSRALLTQSWVGITAASVAVLSIAIGGWLLWSYSGSETEPTVAVTDQQAQDNASKQPDGAPEDKADAAARQEKNGTAGQLAGTGKVDIAAAAKTNQPITPGTENSVAPAGSTPPAAPEAAVNGAAPAAQPTVASSATEIAQAAGAPPPAAKLRLEPVENAAAGRPANGLPLVPDNEKVPEAVSTTPVTDGTGGDATGADPDKDAAVGAAGESDQTAEDVPVAVLARRIEPRQVVVGQQLEQTLAGVSFQRTPLIDFLTTVSQLSTIPIALDADALISRGLAVDTPVSAASQKQISVQDLCKQALTPLGLTVVPHDRYLVVTTRTEASGSRHARYAVDDLIRNGNATTKELAIGIRHLIAPDSWLGTGGEGKIDLSRDALEVDQTDVVHDQIVTLCEKLRVARGLPLRTRYDARQPALAGFNPKRYETTSRTQQAKQLLSRKVTAGVGRPAPLSVVTNYLQQQTNGIILIDVAALAEADLSALSETTLSVKDQPLDQALTQLTKPLGLTWRVLDARTIEITTPEAAAARPDCELYSVRDQQKNAETSLAFEQRLRQQLMAATKLTESELRTHYDSASQVLVVSAPAATQRLIEAELTRSRAGVK